MKNFYIGVIALAILASGIWPAKSQADTIRESVTLLVGLNSQYESNFFKTEKKS